jgi:hypothetical protein
LIAELNQQIENNLTIKLFVLSGGMGRLIIVVGFGIVILRRGKKA